MTRLFTEISLKTSILLTPLLYCTILLADPTVKQVSAVPNNQYEQLKQEVETLKSQMKMLLQQAQNGELKTAAQPNKKPARGKTGNRAPETAKRSKTKTAQAVKVRKKPPQIAVNEHKNNGRVEMEPGQGNRQKEAEEKRTELDTFLRSQVVLFNRGEVALEFNMAYSQDTTANACFDTNLLMSSRCQRNSVVAPKFITRTVDTGLLLRYGIIDNLELDVGISYGYIDQEQNFIPFDVPNQVRHNSSIGVGDLTWALRYTAIHENGIIPNVTLNVNAKSRTGDASRRLGTGFWNVGGGISLLKTIDPVVFFGSVGYTSVLERRGIDPGDQIPYSLGTGFSLNDRVSFLASLAGSAIRRTKFRGREIPGTSRDIHTFQFSSTIQLTKRLFLEPFVAVGLTEEASDFVVGFNVPYRFEDRFPIPFLGD